MRVRGTASAPALMLKFRCFLAAALLASVGPCLRPPDRHRRRLPPAGSQAPDRRLSRRAGPPRRLPARCRSAAASPDWPAGQAAARRLGSGRLPWSVPASRSRAATPSSIRRPTSITCKLTEPACSVPAADKWVPYNDKIRADRRSRDFKRLLGHQLPRRPVGRRAGLRVRQRRRRQDDRLRHGGAAARQDRRLRRHRRRSSSRRSTRS